MAIPLFFCFKHYYNFYLNVKYKYVYIYRALPYPAIHP